MLDKLKLITIIVICIFTVPTIYAKEVIEPPITVDLWTKYKTKRWKLELTGKGIMVVLNTIHKQCKVKFDNMPSEQRMKALKTLRDDSINCIDKDVNGKPSNTLLKPIIIKCVESLLPH